MTINNICLSADGCHVELWNNGNRIRTCALQGSLHNAVADLRDYIRAWGGDDSPNIDRELQAKLDASDATFQRMAFGAEWR